MSELDPHTLDEAWKAAWKATPLPEYPVSGADLAAFNYGRDCAAAAVKALRDIHPIRERRKHERKIKEAIAASVDTLPKDQDAKQGLAGTEGSAVAIGETPTPSPAQPGDA